MSRSKPKGPKRPVRAKGTSGKATTVEAARAEATIQTEPVADAQTVMEDASDDDVIEEIWPFLLPAAVAWFEADEIDKVMKGLPLAEQRAVLRSSGIRVEPRFVKGGVGRLLRARLRAMPMQEIVDGPCLRLMRPAFVALEETFGEDWYERADELDLSVVLDTVVEAGFGAGYARLLFSYEAHGRDNEHPLVDFLTSDSRIGAHPTVWMAAGFAYFENLPVPAPSLEPATATDIEDAETGEPEPQEDDPTPETPAELFTPLDELMVKTIVATYTEIVGSYPGSVLRQIVDEFVSLNVNRPSLFFHQGFLDVLDPDSVPVTLSGMNDERRRWYRYGVITALVRQGDPKRLRDEIVLNASEADLVLRDPTMSNALLFSVLEALLDSDLPVVVELLGVVHRGFKGSTRIMSRLYEHARGLLADDRVAEAESLFRAMAGNEDAVAQFGWPDLLRRVSACQRARGDFAGALASLAEAELTLDLEDSAHDATAALLAVERGMIAARIGHLSHIRFPNGPAASEAVVARLEAGAPDFQSAYALDPMEPRANYCLGVLAFCNNEPASASHHLEQAETGMFTDEAFQRAGLVDPVRFYRGLAMLQTLNPGVDGPAYKLIEMALESGYEPSGREITQIAEAFGAHQSRHTGRFLELACERVRHTTGISQAVMEAAEAADPGAARAAEVLFRDRRLSAVERLGLAAAAIDGAARLGDEPTAERLVEEAADLVAESASPQLDRAWADLLVSHERLRDVLGPLEADAERIEVLRRIDAREEAVVAAEALFHRVASGQAAAYGGDEIIELIEELGAPENRVADLRRRLPRHLQDDVNADVADAGEVRLVFVGGNETQEQYRRDLDQRFANAGIWVQWHFPGWSSNWPVVAERATCDLETSDALVLMALVRTNMGRRMRRVAGELDKPWIPCSGHGREAIGLAIERAAKVVRRIRTEIGSEQTRS